MGARNYIDIDWPDLFKPIPGLDREKYNRIRINREVIPIIFVPGIMGSRLRNKISGESVWDPDRELMCMLLKYGAFWNKPAQRKRMLIGKKFDCNYLEVDEKKTANRERVGTTDDASPRSRGWGGIYLDSYGSFLEHLQNHQWERPRICPDAPATKEMVGNCFEFPVHAFGYNWTDSNLNSGEKLANRIEQIIGQYRSKGRVCNYVILISHSMGGLVCRSACMLHKAEKKVLGVIHGVQPATGSPAAYWRMKAGFERTGTGIWEKAKSTVSAWVLGTNGEEVTCILGNAPGGLELLPNKHYRDNKGNAGWLRIPTHGGKETALPQKGDPYEEIYREKKNLFWRLVTPEWLHPVDGNSDRRSTRSPGMNRWDNFLECLTAAHDFHESLKLRCHKNTYQFYSSGVNTVDTILFSNEELAYITRYEEAKDARLEPYVPVREPVKVPSYRGERIMYANSENEEITEPLPEPDKTYILTMLHPQLYRGGGDGTVPESSAKALETVLETQEIKMIEHQDVYSQDDVIKCVISFIELIALQRIEHVTKNGGNLMEK